MEKTVKVLSFDKIEIRTIDIDGKRWAVAVDICKALNIKATAYGVKRLDDDDKLLLRRYDLSVGADIWEQMAVQVQMVTVVSENGATDLVLASRKPDAQRFRRWLTHEVWPALRESGWFESFQDDSVGPADNTGISLVADAEHHLYLLEIVGRGVKVGISANPTERIATLKREADNYGFTTGRTNVSQPHVEARVNERQIMALGGPENRREYLLTDFDTATSAIEQLPMSRIDRTSWFARRRVGFDLIKGIVTGQAKS